MLEETSISFDILGLYNGSMLMKDREGENLWSCYNGVALYGPRQGEALRRVPAFLCQLSEWLEVHPDSEILRWTNHPLHEDPRHGHGCWFHFGGQGQHPHAMATMLDRKLDERLPERELVLGICHPAGEVAFPLTEVHRQGCLVATSLGDEPIAVLAHGSGSSWMGAYSRRIGDDIVSLTSAGDGRFHDTEGNVWNVEGRALEGPRAGQCLPPLDFVTIKWNAWSGFYPHSEVYRAAAETAPGPEIDSAGFGPLFTALGEAGLNVEVTSEELVGTLPPAASRGLCIEVSGDPFLAYHFECTGAAGDFAESRLLIPRDRFISFYPDEEASDLPRHCKAGGHFVLESNPHRQYADLSCLERLPEGEIEYSGLVDDPKLCQTMTDLGDMESHSGHFARLFSTLEDAGYAVCQKKPMLRQWLRPEAVDGYSADVRGDRFLIYRFADAETAASYQKERHHSVLAGSFVLRSDPPGQYHVYTEQTYNRPSEEVPWSCLLDDPGFLETLRRFSKG